MTAQPNTPVTIASLIAQGHLHQVSIDAGSHRTRYTREALDALLAGVGKPLEEQVTYFLSCTDGALERVCIEYLLEAAGVQQDPARLRLISGKQFNAETGAADGRSIDLVVRRKADDGSSVPVIGVEAKYGAWVNGALGYCPDRPGEYSNQAICYLHGCISEMHSTEHMAFLWIGHEATQTVEFPWGRKGFTEKDGATERFASVYIEQVAVAGIWHRATWEGLAAAIESKIGGPEGSAIARFLLRTGE
ncbi:hypothetical protein ACX80N_12665 [Arthrobacter sp. MDT2-16]